MSHLRHNKFNMSSTKSLGLVRAIQKGLTPPTNTVILWYDDNVGQKIHKYYDVITSTWIPLGSGGGGGSNVFNGNRAITRGVPSLYGVNVGTATITDFLEKTFFIAENPSLSLSISGGSVRRFGESPAVTLNWSLTKRTKGITNIIVDGTSFPPSANVDQDTDTSGNSQGGTKNGSAVQNVDTSFNMSITDTASTVFNTSTALYWQNERFFFVSSIDLMAYSDVNLSNFLNALGSGRELASGRQQTKAFSPVGQFIYFAWKQTYGGNPLTDFVMNGLPNTAWQQKDFSYTNNAATPYNTQFKLTRSQNTLNANFTVIVN